MDGVSQIMTKWPSLPLLALTSLQADGINPDDLGSIYTEAVLFVALFTLMSVFSFIVSKKHAKKYTREHSSPKQSSPEAPNVTDSAISSNDAVANEDKTDRLIALSKMLKEGLITEKEFQLFKQKLIS